MNPAVPWAGVAVTAIVVIAGLIANYAVTHYRVGTHERELREAVAELRAAIKSVSEKLEPAVGHAFSLDAQAKAIDTLEREVRRAREWIHRLRSAVSNVILLLHLIRKGIDVPASAIDKVAADLTAADADPDDSPEGK